MITLPLTDNKQPPESIHGPDSEVFGYCGRTGQERTGRDSGRHTDCLSRFILGDISAWQGIRVCLAFFAPK